MGCAQDELQLRRWEREDDPRLNRQQTGTWVKCDGQLGFAKLNNLGQEWLAAKLGELAKTQVAKVEFGIVASQRSAVSHVRSPHSAPLGCENFRENALGPALRRASGLIVLLAWIGAEDHAKKENYVATPVGAGDLHIEAIDFEHTFGGQLSAPFSRELQLPALLENADGQQVGASLNAILSANQECVAACCERSGLSDWKEIADQLIRRRRNLPQWLEKEGLIA